MGDRAQSIERAFLLLELLGQSDRGLSISDLADRTGLPLDMIHRLVSTKIDLGYVEQIPEIPHYSLDLRFCNCMAL